MLGWWDYITGYEMSFFVFYSVPVGLAAWYVGRWAGIMVNFGRKGNVVARGFLQRCEVFRPVLLLMEQHDPFPRFHDQRGHDC